MTSRRLIAALVLVVGALSIASATAAAAPKTVPPGVSGESQYTETLPGPGGNSPTGGGGAGGGASRAPAQALGEENARKLEALGPEGKAAAELAAESTPRHAGGNGHGSKGQSQGQGGSQSSNQTSGSSGIEQVLGQITGTGGSNSGGMSWLLPVLIGASILGAVTYLLGRRRAARPQD